ncbi:MAG: MATE family efflux transporter [Fibrobacter sp.]|nr:MATE family efflux transporter [Fibrobacter sp.]
MKRNLKKGGFQEILIVALPMLLSMSFDTLMTFVSRLFLSRLSPEYMNAALSGGLTQIMVLTFFTGLISYTTALVAQNFGANLHQNVAKVLTQALLLSFISAPLLLLLKPLGFFMLSFGEINPIQLEAQKSYFNFLIYGSIFSLLRHSFSCFFSGIGKTKIVMQAAFIGMGINIILNYVFIFGHFFIPPMGIQGAALATIVSNATSMSILAFAYFSKKQNSLFNTRHSFVFHKKLFLELVRKGSSTGTEMFLNMLAFQSLILLFHGLGPTVATASTIMFNWDMVSFVPLLGLEVATMSLVGRYVGAKDIKAAHRATQSALLLGFSYTLILAAIFVSIPEYLVNVFKPELNISVFRESTPLAIFMLKLAAIYVITESFMLVFAGALRGAGDTFWVMIAMISLNWMATIFLWFSTYYLKLGPYIGWLSVVFAFLCFPVILFMRYRSGKWHHKISL